MVSLSGVWQEGVGAHAFLPYLMPFSLATLSQSGANSEQDLRALKMNLTLAPSRESTVAAALGGISRL